MICTIKGQGRRRGVEVSSYKQLSEAVKGRGGARRNRRPQGSFSHSSSGLWRYPTPLPARAVPEGLHQDPASFPRAPLTLPLGPGTLKPRTCSRVVSVTRCAGAAAGPTRSSAGEGPQPAPPEIHPHPRAPRSPCQTQTQRHGPRTPVEGQRAGWA